MVLGLFALILIFGIVGSVAFLRSGKDSISTDVSEVESFDIKEE